MKSSTAKFLNKAAEVLQKDKRSLKQYYMTIPTKERRSFKLYLATCVQETQVQSLSQQKRLQEIANA